MHDAVEKVSKSFGLFKRPKNWSSGRKADDYLYGKDNEVNIQE